ncbi:MAG TPA: hypothetical protein VK972_03080 [Wenzhouxiangella sp.]|nr:hypothetical protein [Wenzhouxiangella sp.]
MTPNQRFRGKGRIAGESPGLVTVGGAPSQRKVLCMDSASHSVVSISHSAPDGTYRFSNLDPSRRYYLVAFDHTETYNAVIRDNITPVTE